MVELNSLIRGEKSSAVLLGKFIECLFRVHIVLHGCASCFLYHFLSRSLSSIIRHNHTLAGKLFSCIGQQCADECRTIHTRIITNSYAMVLCLFRDTIRRRSPADRRVPNEVDIRSSSPVGDHLRPRSFCFSSRSQRRRGNDAPLIHGALYIYSSNIFLIDIHCLLVQSVAHSLVESRSGLIYQVACSQPCRLPCGHRGTPCVHLQYVPPS